MSASPVARVYAEALLGLGQERGRIDDYGAELDAVAGIVRDQADVDAFLDSPAIGPEDKKRALRAAFSGRLDDTLIDFVCLLVDKGRVDCLADIAAAYRQLADEANRRQRVHAASAVPLPDDLRQRLEELLHQRLQRQCVLETVVQPELLGGLVLTIGDKVYDGSVSSRLRRLRHAMMRSSGYED